MKDKNFDEFNEMEFITELYTFDDVLSTIDNPYHPLEEFDSWYQYDTEHKHNTLQLIARIADFRHEEDDNQMQARYAMAISYLLENDEEEKYKLF